jgi:hypothetical protein
MTTSDSDIYDITIHEKFPLLNKKLRFTRHTFLSEAIVTGWACEATEAEK